MKNDPQKYEGHRSTLMQKRERERIQEGTLPIVCILATIHTCLDAYVHAFSYKFTHIHAHFTFQNRFSHACSIISTHSINYDNSLIINVTLNLAYKYYICED